MTNSKYPASVAALCCLLRQVVLVVVYLQVSEQVIGVLHLGEGYAESVNVDVQVLDVNLSSFDDLLEEDADKSDHSYAVLL